MMITSGTDAKALAQLGIPGYGFAPMRFEPDFPFLELFHGHDERVPVSALAFGLPVLAEVVAQRGALTLDSTFFRGARGADGQRNRATID